MLLAARKNGVRTSGLTLAQFVHDRLRHLLQTGGCAEGTNRSISVAATLGTGARYGGECHRHSPTIQLAIVSSFRLPLAGSPVIETRIDRSGIYLWDDPQRDCVNFEGKHPEGSLID